MKERRSRGDGTLRRPRVVALRLGVAGGCVALLLGATSLAGQEAGERERAAHAEPVSPEKPVSGRAELPSRADDPETDALLRLWARSYYPGRSGDLFLIPARGDVVTAASVPFMHGSPWDYDARVPLILYGPGHVAPGTYETAAGHQDMGATVAAWLGLPRRPTTTGRVLSEALLEGEGEPPRTVAVLVIDGFRTDYLERYPKETRHLSRLAKRGAWFPRTRVNVLPTATAVSHTTLVTATDPAFHGITGNTIYDRARAEAFSAFHGTSAENVMVASLADRWSAQTRGRAVIAAQGGTFYPAAALAGRGRCAFGGRPVLAAYFDSRTGGWNSNQECYRLPGYLIDQNIQTLLAEAQAEGGEEASASGARRMASVFPRFEGDATIEILTMEPFGEDEVTDLLLVNHKATDYIGHSYGPGSEKMREALAEVDRQVGRLVETLDARLGRGAYVLLITSDHGMPDEPPEGGRHVYAEIEARLDAHFGSEEGAIVLHYDGADNQIYLDHERLEALELTPADVARFLETLPVFRAVFTEKEVQRAADALSEAGSDVETR